MEEQGKEEEESRCVWKLVGWEAEQGREGGPGVLQGLIPISSSSPTPFLNSAAA